MLKTKEFSIKLIPKIKRTLLPKPLFWSIINLVLFLPYFVCADEVGVTTGNGSSALRNPLAVDSVSELVKAVAEVVMKIGFMVAVVFIIYSGFLYVSARGSEEKLKKAHETFTWTIIGTAVILGAWTIAIVIESTIKSLK